MSFQNTSNPTGGVNMEHVMEVPNPNEHLLERILSTENVKAAEYRMQMLAEYLRGWMNYFGISSVRPIPEMNHWLRRRIRMCYWKQWRRCRTKVRNLLKLGTPLDAAISVGMCRKGPWRLARTFATQIGMTNQWLKGQGLISLKELCVNIHYPATAR
jgi:RNA-directed DNA polymerase